MVILNISGMTIETERHKCQDIDEKLEDIIQQIIDLGALGYTSNCNLFVTQKKLTEAAMEYCTHFKNYDGIDFNI